MSVTEVTQQGSTGGAGLEGAAFTDVLAAESRSVTDFVNSGAVCRAKARGHPSCGWPNLANAPRLPLHTPSIPSRKEPILRRSAA